MQMNMPLAKYDGEYVSIEDIDGKIWQGKVGDYVEPIHNEHGKASIVIDVPKLDFPVELREDEIKTIEILEERKTALA